MPKRTDRTAMWWERRRKKEPTNEYLARVLAAAELPDMSRRARAYHFDDYRAPESVDCGDNMTRLYQELQKEAFNVTSTARLRILAIASAVVQGEFDGTKEEADAWFATPEGQAAVRVVFGIREQ